MTVRRLSRRTVLKGLGTALALPMLECMRFPARAANAAELPKRLAFVFVPNGAHMPDWTPAEEGASFVLPRILEPLAPVRGQITVLSGLTHDKARPNGDGPGDHARSASAFLTASQPRKTHGADIKVGVSIDQHAAQHIGGQTRLPSLELGIDAGANSGNCDSGYSCAYSANISWRTENTPQAKEVNPRAVFTRLFGDPTQVAVDRNRALQQSYERSILDFVLAETQTLERRLGAADRRKLDEYLASVRDIEQRIQAAERPAAQAPPDFAIPKGVPQENADHIRLMFDLLALAFQTDATRIATFMLANEGSNRSYAFMGVPEGHHDLSHHGRNREKQEKISKINRYHMELFATFLQKLHSTPEGEGTLLDQSLIVYGSAIGDGDRHNHDDLPVLLAGSGGGTVAAGRHIAYSRDTPMANLYLSLMDRMHVPAEAFGDSTGRLDGLEG